MTAAKMMLMLFLITGDDEPRYAVNFLNNNLTKNARAVIRRDVTTFEVKNEQDAKLRVDRVVTVLTKDGREAANLVIPYDRFRSIEHLEGRLFDSNGTLIRKMGRDDVSDYSAISSYSLYEDSRVRTVELYHDRFPYTVELSYELSYDGYITWPTWYAQEGEDPVELTKYEIIIPSSMDLRYWCNNDSLAPAISSVKKNTSYAWTATNLSLLSKEALQQDPEDVTFVVRTAPAAFIVDAHKGDMTSWKNFGAWYYQLSKGRDVLPDQARQEIQTIVKSDDGPEEKIRKLYEHLQSTTRYVSVQLGIGGWQPFDAAYVHKRGYGDCKALSNYMVALLGEVGVNAYPVLIESGTRRRRMLTEFPNNQFNHVIVCVPQPKDTIWLECTSQSSPFGHLGKESEDRGALLITPEGGVMVRTPASTSHQNAQRRRAHVVLSTSGSAVVTAATTRTGNQQDYIRNALEYATPAERERWILSDLQQPTASIRNYGIVGIENRSNEVTLSLQLTLPRYASISGNRIMFQPNLMERRTFIPREDPERKYPVHFHYRYHDTDSISFRIPEGFAFEALPPARDIEATFGSFKSKTTVYGDSIAVLTRSLDIHESVIPPAGYTEYQKFFAEVVKADRAQVVLVRKSP